MKNTKKTFWGIEYIVLNTFSLIMFLSSLYTIEVQSLISDSASVSGLSWIKALADNNLGRILGWISADLGSVRIVLLLLVFIPIILMIMNLVVHILGFVRGSYSKKNMIWPVITIISMLLGILIINLTIQKMLDTYAGFLGNFASLLFLPAAGQLICIIFHVIMAIQDLVLLPKLSAFHPAAGSAERQAVIPERKAYGVLKCLRGEYEGAELKMEPGDVITIGRDKNECHFIFEDLHVSRKHLSLYFDDRKQKYILTNLSKNGTLLADGTLLPLNQPYEVSCGTAFRINEQNVFRLM